MVFGVIVYLTASYDCALSESLQLVSCFSMPSNSLSDIFPNYVYVCLIRICRSVWPCLYRRTRRGPCPPPCWDFLLKCYFYPLPLRISLYTILVFFTSCFLRTSLLAASFRLLLHCLSFSSFCLASRSSSSRWNSDFWKLEQNRSWEVNNTVDDMSWKPR